MKGAIIYMSSNKEDPEFEERVFRDMLSKKGELPVIVVTQNKMDFYEHEGGKGYGVGDVGTSGLNFIRQVQIACQHADADYVIHAEADSIYSPEYFNFVPPKLDACYRNSNIYVQKYRQDFVCKKEGSTFSSIVGRKFYLKRLEELFKGQPMWNAEYKNFPKEIRKLYFDKYEYFETENACISFKTGDGMRKHSPSSELPVYDLPYWGSIKELKEKYKVV